MFVSVTKFIDRQVMVYIFAYCIQLWVVVKKKNKKVLVTRIKNNYLATIRIFVYRATRRELCSESGGLVLEFGRSGVKLPPVRHF